MKLVSAAFAGLILLVLAIIGIQNPTLISIRFLGWQTGVLPLWVIIVGALAIGMLLVGIITIPGRISRYRITRRLRSRLADATDGSQNPPAPSAERSPAPSHPGRNKHML